MLTSRRVHLDRLKTLRFLNELEAASGKAKSLYLPSGTPQPEILLEKALSWQSVPADMAQLVAGSMTGAALFWGSSRTCLILPPFPITEEYFTQGYNVEPLRSLLKHDFTVALVLVRLGAYAFGICRGEKLITSKVGTGLIHARHKKGGSSQRRFERHREKQIEYFLGRVCDHVRERLEPYDRVLDYMVYGGSRTAIMSLQKDCSFLRHFDSRVLRLLLDIPEPRQAVLEAAIRHVWSSSVTEWYDIDVLA